MLAVRLSDPVIMDVEDPMPFKEMSWAELTMKFCSGTERENAPGTVTSPEPAAIVKEWAPSISLPKMTFPPLEERARFPVKLRGPEKAMAEPVVVTAPPILTAPSPVWAKGPLRANVTVGETVASEEFVIEKEPPPVVVTWPFRAKEEPLNVMPERPVVFKTPFNVARPVISRILIWAA